MLLCLLLLLQLLPQILCQACSVKLNVSDSTEDKYKNVFKWKEPIVSGRDSKTEFKFECQNGFVDNRIIETDEIFVCKEGLYNFDYQYYQYSDLLCRSDFHSSLKVVETSDRTLNSPIFKCIGYSWAVYEVSRTTEDGDKLLYKVCFDMDTMRAKYSFKISTNEIPKVQHNTRDDVWGFDRFGRNSEDRLRLSQGYAKKKQQRRTTQKFSDKYNEDNKYPYYFKRGHLVAYADFPDLEDQKSTMEYINTGPQWDVLNENSWSLIEQEARDMLQTNTADWEIYTGTIGGIPTPKGTLFLAPDYNFANQFLTGHLPVPQLFWKLVFNTKDRSKSRAFLGVNNPEIRTIAEIKGRYRFCQKPITRKGQLFQGNESMGFVYECPLEEFLVRLNRIENIVTKLN